VDLTEVLPSPRPRTVTPADVRVGVIFGLRRARLRGPLYPHEPTCSGCPQSKYAASAPSLAASAGLALPRSREGKSRPARDATHTSGLFEFNSEILRMNQAHRSRAGKLQRFDHPRPLDLTGSIPTLMVPMKVEFGPLCPPRSPCRSQIDNCYPPGILTTLISIAEK
jgi:hypothetical protein